MSRELALQAKELGNQEFSAKNYQQAIEHFSKAIEYDPTDHVFFSNRSACYASVGKYQEALADAQQCVSLKPDWVRGYTRKALAEHYLQRYDEAVATYDKALELEPDNQSLKDGKQASLHEKQKAQNPLANVFNAENMAKLMTNPRTAAYFQQQDFMQMLQMAQQNPQMMQMFMQDQRFMDCLAVALNLNMNTTSEEEQHQQPAYQPPPQQAAPQQQAPSYTPPQNLSEEQKKVQQAEEEKNLGNQCYRKKQFDKAIEHYENALQINPSEVNYINNKAAVYFETKDYNKCIELCDEAIEKGREQRADMSKIARAMARKGNALVALDQFDEGLELVKSANREYFDSKVKFRIRDLEKLKKKRDEEAYINPELAEEHNAKGNDLFKNGKFVDAISEYDEAIRRNPRLAKLYSNRAAVFIKLMEPVRAQTDIDKCLEIDPNFIRGYARKGQIHFMMKEYHKALEAYEKGMKIDPNNNECSQGYQQTMYAINSASANQPDEERLRHAMADPEIQNIMSDPQMRQILTDLQERPHESQSYLQDPKIRTALNKLVAAGVVKLG